MRMCMAALLVVLAAGFAVADGVTTYADGYVDSNGYVYSNGYWTKGGVRFTRTTRSEPYYYYQNYCRYQGYREAYSYAPVLDSKDQYGDDWRARLLDIAKQRDAYELKARQSALSQNEFLQSLRVLGLDGNFRLENYGASPGYAINPYNHHGANVANAYSQLAAPQGATIYGYRELADIYGNVDLGALYQQVMRLRQQSYSNEAKATSETHSLVGDLGNQMARIAEIQTKAEAAARVLQAASAPDRTTVLKEFWQQKVGGQAVVPQGNAGPPQAGGAAGGDAQAVVNKKCLACHNATKTDGGLNLADMALLTQPQVAKILDRVVHPDPRKRMPVAADGAPGVPLSRDEIAVFFLGAYAGSAPRQPPQQAAPLLSPMPKE